MQITSQLRKTWALTISLGHPNARAFFRIGEETKTCLLEQAVWCATKDFRTDKHRVVYVQFMFFALVSKDFSTQCSMLSSLLFPYHSRAPWLFHFLAEKRSDKYGLIHLNTSTKLQHWRFDEFLFVLLFELKSSFSLSMSFPLISQQNDPP